jgi:epoxide hydrolase 4
LCSQDLERLIDRFDDQDKFSIVPALMMWGVKDVALTYRMARPSIDHCEDGKLIFFPDATHWVQHDAAEEVNHYPIDFLLDKSSKQAKR